MVKNIIRVNASTPRHSVTIDDGHRVFENVNMIDVHLDVIDGQIKHVFNYGDETIVINYGLLVQNFRML